MVVSARHLHRRNLRHADERGSGDDIDEELGARGGAGRPSRPLPPSLAGSGAVLDALSDENSSLASFLFVKRGIDDNDVGNDHSDSIPSRDMPSMSSCDAGFMALALEPMKIRNERIIMLFEAYAIFGALFMNGVWIIYEWGTWKGYGGDSTNLAVERVFECIMALALWCIVFLALFAAGFWMLSITHNSSHRDYVLGSVTPLVYLYYLLVAIVFLVTMGFLLGTYLNLSPNWPETIVVLCMAVVIYIRGVEIYWKHQYTCCPLEMYHLPVWVRLAYPKYWLRRTRDRLKDRAKQRADELRGRAYRERKKNDPNSGETNGNSGSLEGILRVAARSLGRNDSDVSAFVMKLESDWFTDPAQLKGMSVEFLSRYMPYRLAKEVHRLVEGKPQSAH